MKETDLFPPVKTWLESHGYMVYSEVTPNRIGARADVVGITSILTTVVELKQSLSLDLIEQAIDWKPYAHYIYVAIPRRKNGIKHLVRKLLQENGIGLIEVDFDKHYNHSAPFVLERPTIRAKLHRRISNNIKDSLTEYHLKFSPDGGNAGGGYITTYRITMLKVKELLEAVESKDGRKKHWLLSSWLEDRKGDLVDLHQVTVDGWLDMNTILQYCETHYSSPKPSLSFALQKFETDWCEVKKEKGKLWFRVKREEV